MRKSFKPEGSKIINETTGYYEKILCKCILISPSIKIVFTYEMAKKEEIWSVRQANLNFMEKIIYEKAIQT
jgi:hypothetical protein